MTQIEYSTPEEVRGFAAYTEASPLYTQLVEVVASSDELIRVLNRIENTPQLNILFAAVQFLLDDEPDQALCAFYPNHTDEPGPASEIGPFFIDFVVTHEEEIAEIGRTRFTQTNECLRCTALFPAVASVPFDACHLIDVGTSAGLNLAMDRYGYRWGDLEWGADSPLILESELRGTMVVPRDVEFISRVGLDLNPVLPTNAEDRRWLNALIWPEENDRKPRLNAALDLVADVPISYVAGNAVETLQSVLDGLSPGEPAVVMNSLTLNQFSVGQRESLDRVIQQARNQRDVVRVTFEVYTSPNQWPNLRVDDGTGWKEFGQAHHHGAWVEFYA
ncbi:MAG: DUF2332 domain-containing protein [Actinomycetota bacterium]|nr:DUF2332 domain-containing protein [Actinomycetota bacterium]